MVRAVAVVVAQMEGKVMEKKMNDVEERWPRSFGQDSGIFKWNIRGCHAADFIAGSVAKYASSGV